LIIKNLQVTNFGPFRGTASIDCAPDNIDEDRTITVIGGLNGAGKTHLLEALRLCLFGKRALGSRIRSAEYAEYLYDNVHKDGDGKRALHSSVQIEFTRTEWGRTDRYVVTRSWSGKAKKPLDTLEIYRNSVRVKEIGTEQLQSFLNEIVPVGLADFFFFDGEQIQRLASDDEDNPYLADAVARLLGIDAVDQLVSDLAIVRRRRGGQKRRANTEQEWSDLEGRQKALNERLSELEVQSAEANVEVGKAVEREEIQRQKLASEGEYFSKMRDEMLAEQGNLEGAIERGRTDLRELAEGLLPFAIAGSLCVTLATHLKDEQDHLRVIHALDVLTVHQSGISERLQQTHIQNSNTQLTEGADAGHRSLPENWIASIQDYLRENVDVVPTVTHGFSSSESRQVSDWAEQASSELLESSRKTTDDLESNVNKLREIEFALKKAPTDEVIKPLMDEYSSLQTLTASSRANLVQLENEIQGINNELGGVQIQLFKVDELLSSQRAANRVDDLLNKTRKALQKYQTDLIADRLNSLSDAVTECVSILLHKTGTIERVEIRSNPFKVELLDANGTKISKRGLSAGEKQMIAIAFLWGLAKTSGQQLPLVIDTPMARLDSHHRRQLVSEYFPYASHQVIILSTDSEITPETIAGFASHIQDTYRINWNNANQYSTVEAGYFIESEVANVV
jgi:DNA sulfur modification protein DndD